MADYNFVLFFCSILCIGIISGNKVFVDFDEEDEEFSIFIGNSSKPWFRNSAFRIHRQVWWGTDLSDYTLSLTDSYMEEGKDPIGYYYKYVSSWVSEKNDSFIEHIAETSVLVYEDAPVVRFEIKSLQTYTSTGDVNEVLSTFPSLSIEKGDTEKGWMTWSGNMASSMKFGSAEEKVYGSIDGGFPLVVFDSDMKNAVVLSPLNLFMASTQTTITDQITNKTAVTFGPLGTITEVPAGSVFMSILVAGGNVTDVMKRFGEILRDFYGKDDSLRKSDFSINYLGYWTDNGACYYYHPGKNYSNYEDLLVAVKNGSDKAKLPYRYVQLDSWWYYKGENGGVKNWTARPDIFPNGIESMVAKTGWPVVAHNRYWSPETDYAKKFDFIIHGKGALPNDAGFWDYLLSSSQKNWNLIVYEQDWLDLQMNLLENLKTSLGLGERWLLNMGESAQRYGLTIQYCMPWPRHLLQSVMSSAVTQIRVSGDYQPGNNQWVVGDTAILAHAVGLASFKDNFRTSDDQSDFGSGLNEHYPVLETYTASLTGGPVGPSDMIGKENSALIMATCMPDGRLLKPTRPMMSLDSTILQRTFGKGGPKGHINAAFTEIDGFSWYYIMAAELEDDYALSATELPPTGSTFPASHLDSVAFQYDVFSPRVANVFGIEKLTEDDSITIEKCDKDNFKYIVAAPRFFNGMTLLGELKKFVTVSESRFSRIEEVNDKVEITLTGFPLEIVYISIYDDIHWFTIECAIGDSGYGHITITDGDGDTFCS